MTSIFDDDDAELRRVLKEMRDEQDRRHEALLDELARDRAAEPDRFGQARIARAYADGPTPSEIREQRKERRRSRQKTDGSQR